MSAYRLRRSWLVRVDDPFALYVADATEARTKCLRDVITRLHHGTIDLVVSGLLPNLYFIFACDVTISATVHDDTVVLIEVTEEDED